MVIWKQKVNIHPLQMFMLPEGARILSVGSAYEYDSETMIDRECVFFWFLCDPEAPKTKRYIQVCLTGGQDNAPLADDSVAKFIGTLQLDDGFVIHIFERLLA